MAGERGKRTKGVKKGHFCQGRGVCSSPPPVCWVVPPPCAYGNRLTSPLAKASVVGLEVDHIFTRRVFMKSRYRCSCVRPATLKAPLCRAQERGKRAWVGGAGRCPLAKAPGCCRRRGRKATTETPHADCPGTQGGPSGPAPGDLLGVTSHGKSLSTPEKNPVTCPHSHRDSQGLSASQLKGTIVSPEEEKPGPNRYGGNDF